MESTAITLLRLLGSVISLVQRQPASCRMALVIFAFAAGLVSICQEQSYHQITHARDRVFLDAEIHPKECSGSLNPLSNFKLDHANFIFDIPLSLPILVELTLKVSEQLLWTIASSIFLRCGLVLATFLHEWSHMLAIMLLLGDPPSLLPRGGSRRSQATVWKKWWVSNSFANVPLRLWLQMLNPLSPMPRDFRPHVTTMRTVSSSDLKNAGGFFTAGGCAEPSLWEIQRMEEQADANGIQPTPLIVSKSAAPPRRLSLDSRLTAVRYVGWLSTLMTFVLASGAYIHTIPRSGLPSSSQHQASLWRPCQLAGQGTAVKPADWSTASSGCNLGDGFLSRGTGSGPAMASGWSMLPDFLLGLFLCLVSCTASDLCGVVGECPCSALGEGAAAANADSNYCKESSASPSSWRTQSFSFFCGNFGLLVAGAASGMRKRAVDALSLLEAMAAISTERGGQSGGVVSFLPCRERGGMMGVRCRVRPGKRESLSKLLIGRFRICLALASTWDWLRSALLAPLAWLRGKLRMGRRKATEVSSASADGQGTAQEEREAARKGSGHQVQVFAGHTRFATSSIPIVSETHPHQWCPPRQVDLWAAGGGGRGKIERRRENFEAFVTHNGDFEFWNLFGRDRTHSELGPWLQVVLGCPQQVSCDSGMIAGLMDLLRTQGMWDASLRLSFHQTVIMSYEDVFETTANGRSAAFWNLPSPAALQLLAEVASGVTERFASQLNQSRCSSSGSSSNSSSSGRRGHSILLNGPEREKLTAEIQAAIRSDGCSVLETLADAPEQGELLSSLSEEALDVFSAQAVANFLDNDLFWAAKKFISNAKGSFGMSVACSLESDRLVLAALNQPLSVGFSSPQLATVLYSSESHALSLPLLPRGISRRDRQGSEGGSAELAAGKRGATKEAGRGEDGISRHVLFRLDLNEDDGEVLELAMRHEVLQANGDGGLDGESQGGSGEIGGKEQEHEGQRRGAWQTVEEAVGAVERDLESGGVVVGESEREEQERTGAGMEEQNAAMVFPQIPFVEMRLFNVRAGLHTSKAELESKRRLVAMQNNPFASFQDETRCHGDLVAADIKDIPRLLSAIRQDWMDSSSLNRQTAAALFQLLLEKARREAAAGEEEEGGEQQDAEGVNRKEIDVLITGVESSLWVAEQFAADLQNCFPRLRVVAMSANKVIGVMGNARGAISTAGFSFCRITSALSASRAIVIAVSQSGQTFPTLHATRILAKHCPGRVFVCVGLLDSKMSAAVGHSLDPSLPFCRRVLCTLSGWRSAEPSSLTAVATHATLTELMLHLARHLRAAAATTGLQSAAAATDSNLSVSISHPVHAAASNSAATNEMGASDASAVSPAPQGSRDVTHIVNQKLQQSRVAPTVLIGRRPLGLRLSEQDISDLERMRDALVWRSARDICGADEEGKVVKSDVNNELQKQGNKWAQHVLESPISWAMSAAYIFGVVISGWPLFIAISRAIPFHSSSAETAVTYVAHVLDSALFVFLPLITALILRLLQGRDLFARIGKRTLVIADVPYVHQLLETYVSKMFSLSFWIASLEVHGASPIDHFVHRFTHRVTRGTLIALGRPDGRLCSQTKCESWVLMALLQARTIVNLKTGAEAITVGHNPFSSPAVIKKHLLLPSNRPKFLCEKLLGVHDDEPLKRMASREYAVADGKSGRNLFDALDSQVIGTHLCDEGTVQRARQLGLSILSHGMRDIEEDDSNLPATRDAVLSAMDLDVKAVLQSQAPLEEMTENRFLSLERLLSFQVMFHQMAATVASLWPLQFDISRSQSCLRIATTAAPISAADLEREWLETVAHHDASLDFTVHRLRPVPSHHRISDAFRSFLPSPIRPTLHTLLCSPHGSGTFHGGMQWDSKGNLSSFFSLSPGASSHSVKAGDAARVLLRPRDQARVDDDDKFSLADSGSAGSSLKGSSLRGGGTFLGGGGSLHGGVMSQGNLSLHGGGSLHGVGILRPVLDVSAGSSYRGGMAGGIFALEAQKRGSGGGVGGIGRSETQVEQGSILGDEESGKHVLGNDTNREKDPQEESLVNADKRVKGGKMIHGMLQEKRGDKP